MTATLDEEVLSAISRATDGLGPESKEIDFQRALANELRPSERELPATFAAPALPPRRPPSAAIDELAKRKPSRLLPPAGVDPCAARAKLDLLWHSAIGAVPIELKFCGRWKADTNGYQFLKDLHRLERMVAAGGHTTLSSTRFAAFVTNERVYWRGERPEPRPFWLTHGSEITAGRWFQYDQVSPDTLWYSYPPFFLANTYRIEWRELRPTWRCLLVAVRPQATAHGG